MKEEIFQWLSDQADLCGFTHQAIHRNELSLWEFDQRHNIRHESGKFFSIEGLCYKKLNETMLNFQPIINQPEHGILGIVVRQGNNGPEVLLQAKVEPGNIGKIQLSPTVQATKSNFTKVHKGAPVPYIEFFQGAQQKMLFRRLQSEHGFKFYRKANLNMMVEVDEDLPIKNNYRWFDIDEVYDLLQFKNIINMDARSVLSSFDGFENCSVDSTPILLWLDERRKEDGFQTELVPLDRLFNEGWSSNTEFGVYSDSCPDFEVMYLKIRAGLREVKEWTQPIVKDRNPKMCVLVVSRELGKIEVLGQACIEACSWDGPEIGPTIHNVKDGNLGEYLSDIDSYMTLYDCWQSEEGGRFYQQQNRYIIVEAKRAIAPLSVNHRWISLPEVKSLLGYDCKVNIEMRTLVTCLDSLKLELG